MTRNCLKFSCVLRPENLLRKPVSEIVARLNELVELGTLVDRSGEPVSEKIEGGLICRDGKYLYPVRENIPILLIERFHPVA